MEQEGEKMKVLASGRKAGAVMGIVFIAVGILLLLRTLGIYTFSIWEGFATYWPVGIILVGVALIFHKRFVASALFALLLVFGAIYLTDSLFSGGGQYREIILEQALEVGVENLALDLDFGAGSVKIAAGDEGVLFKNIVNTNDENGPKFDYSREGADAEIAISRHSDVFRTNIKNTWDIKLSPSVSSRLDLDFGATDFQIDLNGLDVESINIDSGASRTAVIFGKKPVQVDINTGASSIDLQFPEGIGVKVKIDGGAVGTDLDGFIKDGKEYKSKDYDDYADKIMVNIDAGASQIKGRFYADTKDEAI